MKRTPKESLEVVRAHIRELKSELRASRRRPVSPLFFARIRRAKKEKAIQEEIYQWLAVEELCLAEMKRRFWKVNP